MRLRCGVLESRCPVGKFIMYNVMGEKEWHVTAQNHGIKIVAELVVA
jgi:putative lipase involved disintegration of autophagic bodies